MGGDLIRDGEREVFVASNVRGISTLGDGIAVGGSVGINPVRAVVLIVALAVLALEAGRDLGADTDTVSNLDGLDCGADLDGMANDFVAYTDGKRNLTPAAIDAVYI